MKEVYYPAVEKVLKEATGATRVYVFDHTKRYGHASIEEAVGGEKTTGSIATASGLPGQLSATSADKEKLPQLYIHSACLCLSWLTCADC